jgi:aldose 1-epimerase
MEEGYPGDVQTTVDFTLENRNELAISYHATVAHKATPINLCNHAYWNLSGSLKHSIRDHILELNCKYFLPVDKNMIPSGKLEPVSGTPMAFPLGLNTCIGTHIDSVDGGGESGYDHCYVVDKESDDGSGLCLVARAIDPESGRVMEVRSTEPGVQLYTGNWLSKDLVRDHPHTQHNAFCLETQHFPDSVNQLQFPSIIHGPGASYVSKTVHTFYTE